MIRFTSPVSSSSVMNRWPLAVGGAWRTTTMPATLTSLPAGWAASSAASSTPRARSLARHSRSG